MKWFRYLSWTLFAGLLFYYLLILGGPIRNLIELRGCSVGYTHYLTNKYLRQLAGAGTLPHE